MTIFSGSGNDPDNPKPRTRMSTTVTMTTSRTADADTARRAPGCGVLVAGKAAAAVPLFPLPLSGEFCRHAGRVLGRRSKAALALAGELGPSSRGIKLMKRAHQRQAAEFRLLAGQMEGGAL